ncbi:hypothetical protein [Flagellimonas maritima]|uniref:hypothetical protein n=1 Tax=Flagellimonas maritima TaxID=1383885 RepID=UPI000F4FBC1A|nr:hypothetical protein [Allomuricauda aurantiaca]
MKVMLLTLSRNGACDIHDHRESEAVKRRNDRYYTHLSIAAARRKAMRYIPSYSILWSFRMAFKAKNTSRQISYHMVI